MINPALRPQQARRGRGEQGVLPAALLLRRRPLHQPDGAQQLGQERVRVRHGRRHTGMDAVATIQCCREFYGCEMRFQNFLAFEYTQYCL